MGTEVDSAAVRVLAEEFGKRVETLLGPLVLTVEKIGDRLDHMHERVLHLEHEVKSPEFKILSGSVEDLKSRVESLQTWQHQVSGALKLFDFIRTAWPFFAALAGLLAYYYLDPGGPR